MWCRLDRPVASARRTLAVRSAAALCKPRRLGPAPPHLSLRSRPASLLLVADPCPWHLSVGRPSRPQQRFLAPRSTLTVAITVVGHVVGLLQVALALLKALGIGVALWRWCCVVVRACVLCVVVWVGGALCCGVLLLLCCYVLGCGVVWLCVRGCGGGVAVGVWCCGCCGVVVFLCLLPSACHMSMGASSCSPREDAQALGR